MNCSSHNSSPLHHGALANEQLAETISGSISKLLDELNPQHQDIFCSRILRNEKISLRILAEKYGKSTERIRLIAKEAEQQIRMHMESYSYRDLRYSIDSIPKVWGSAVPESFLSAHFKPLITNCNFSLSSEEVINFISYLTFGKIGKTGWISKLRIDEIEDELIQYSDIFGIIKIDTAQVLLDLGIKQSFIPNVMAELNRVVLLLHSWVVRKDSYSDKAVQILTLTNHPLSNLEIADYIASADKVRSLTNALQSDARFARTGKNKYGLALWGNETYEGICAAMEKLLIQNGQALEIEFLSSMLSEQYSISKNSVKAYCLAPIFFQDGSKVRLRTPEDLHVINDDIGDLNWAAVNGNTAKLTFLVDGELRRGSGRQLPVNLSWRLGLFPGDSKQLVGEFGQLLFAWNVRSHTGGHLGSLKPLSDGLNCDLGDNLILEIDIQKLRYQVQRG
jgi:hypothetical protein